MKINVKEIPYYKINPTCSCKYDQYDINRMLKEASATAYKKGYAEGFHQGMENEMFNLNEEEMDDSIEWY